MRQASPSPIIAELLEHRSGDTVERTISFESADDQVWQLWWRISGAPNSLPRPLTREDLVVTSLIFYAMRTRRDLHVRGCVSNSVLDNIEVLQQIMTLWRPDLYARISVTADLYTSEHRPVDRDTKGVCAFSGGVDGAATTWRHHSQQAGRLNRELVAGVLIRGFDIPLDDNAGWSTAVRTAGLALDDIGLPFARVETNWRDLVCGDWEMEFAAAAISCLRHWEEDAGSLLLGSGEDYARLTWPWGAHPLVSACLGGGDTVVQYDGGDLTRTAKVALLSEWPVGYNNLRVCWQGKVLGSNCGICEKCIRTKLNAIACGKPIPASLGRRPTKKEVASIKIGTPARLALMKEVLEMAGRNGIDDPLFGTVSNLLARRAVRARLSPFLRPLKSFGRKVVAKFR